MRRRGGRLRRAGVGTGADRAAVQRTGSGWVKLIRRPLRCLTTDAEARGRSSTLEAWTPPMVRPPHVRRTQQHGHPHSPEHHQRDKPALCRDPGAVPSCSNTTSTNRRVVRVSALGTCHTCPRASSRSPKNHQRGGDVVDERVGVRHVRVGQHLGRAAGQGRRKHPIPHGGHPHVRSEEVGGPPDAGTDRPALVRRQQRLGQLGPYPPVRPSRPVRQARAWPRSGRPRRRVQKLRHAACR
jgi:hypothetical protein